MSEQIEAVQLPSGTWTASVGDLVGYYSPADGQFAVNRQGRFVREVVRAQQIDTLDDLIATLQSLARKRDELRREAGE